MDADGNAESNAAVDSAAPANRLMKVAKSLLRIVLLGYATVLVLLVLLESRLVYPGAFMDVPQQPMPDVVVVNYQSSDGTELTGRLFHHPDDATATATQRSTVLYFHGNGITAARESRFIAGLGRRLNANVLAAEYRGFDSLNGSPHEAGVIQDCFAARDFVCDRYGVDPSRLVLYGQSLGGGCAVAVAADSGAQLLVLDRTFDRMVDVAAGRYWFVPVKILMRNRYDSLSRIQSYEGPLIQVHGNADSLIPIAHGQNLHAAAPTNDKQFFEADAMGHNDPMPTAIRDQFIAAIKARINVDAE